MGWWGFAKRKRLCLTSWLRRGPAAMLRAPSMFAHVKSKCFSAAGGKTCRKDGHSCWRRILDMSGVPYRSGWRTVARGVRGVVRAVGNSREPFKMATAVPELRCTDAVASLTSEPTCCCVKCGCHRQYKITVITADIDQAFEACRVDAVQPAWVSSALSGAVQSGSHHGAEES